MKSWSAGKSRPRAKSFPDPSKKETAGLLRDPPLFVSAEAFPLAGRAEDFRQCARIARSKSAMMLVILIIGFTAGPAVSL